MRPYNDAAKRAPSASSRSLCPTGQPSHGIPWCSAVAPASVPVYNSFLDQTLDNSREGRRYKENSNAKRLLKKDLLRNPARGGYHCGPTPNRPGMPVWPVRPQL